MIDITMNDSTYEIKAEGHAGYAKKGFDIVCAGVSCLIENYEMYERNEEVYKFIKFSLKNLEESYPDNVNIIG